MKSPRLLRRKPLLIPLLKNLLLGRDPVPSVPPPVKDLLVSGLPVSGLPVSGLPVSGPLGSAPPGSGLVVSGLPGNVLPGSGPTGKDLPVSGLPAQPPQCTRRKRALIPHSSC